MFSLFFVFDPNFVTACVLSRTKTRNPRTIKFQEEIWERNFPKYWQVATSNPVNVQESLDDPQRRFYLRAARAHPYMQELLRSTIPHLEKCKAEWEENLGRTKPIVEELVGHPIEGHRNVYIVPPQVGEGHNAGNNNIVWGTPNQWPNYTAVYLWHETLHSFFPYNCSDLEHSTIELITDEELRVRLNGGSYPPFVGHPHLTEIKERILPAWRDYVKNPKRIYTFIEEQKAKLEEVKKIKLKK